MQGRSMSDALEVELFVEFAWAADPGLDDVELAARVLECRSMVELMGNPKWRRNGRYLALHDGRARQQRIRGSWPEALAAARDWPRAHVTCEVGLLGSPAHAIGPILCAATSDPNGMRLSLSVRTVGMSLSEVDGWFGVIVEDLGSLAALGVPLVGTVRWYHGQNPRSFEYMHQGVGGPPMVSYWPALWLPHSTVAVLDLEVGRQAGWLRDGGPNGVVVRFAESVTSVVDDDRRRWRAWLEPVLDLNFGGNYLPSKREVRPPEVLPEDWRTEPARVWGAPSVTHIVLAPSVDPAIERLVERYGAMGEADFPEGPDSLKDLANDVVDLDPPDAT